ncbi:MAG: FAD-dependent thymidylate synthase [Spirochaetales bacterium]|nr:FAD-dependent thymidylate synthase [Spirochaetales bacterium]
MAHSKNPEAEKILDKEYKVLDKGFVRLVDFMGGDDRIVQSARVSYGEGTKSVREDKRLIAYLLRNEHMSPFEQVVFTFHIKMPIFVARQWVRHRTARMNEISGRYSVMNDDFYVPAPENVRAQSKRNMQGRADEALEPALQQEVIDYLNQDYDFVYSHYQKMIDKDITRELARINLPLSLYTEMYWQMDLRNLLNFIRLRLDWHAQFEIREYAKVLAEMVKAVTPYTWEAFENYSLGGTRLSQEQLEKLKSALGPDHELVKELKL